MTHLSDLLKDAGIPEDLKRQIREAVRKDMKEAAELLKEVVREHADPDMPFYNDCDDGLCKWCEDATKIIAAQEEA